MVEVWAKLSIKAKVNQASVAERLESQLVPVCIAHIIQILYYLFICIIGIFVITYVVYYICFCNPYHSSRAGKAVVGGTTCGSRQEEAEETRNPVVIR